MKTFNVSMKIKKAMEVTVAAKTVEEAIAAATRLYLNHDLEHLENLESIFAFSKNETEDGLFETTSVTLDEADDFAVDSILKETTLDDETDELFNEEFYEDYDEDFDDMYCENCPHVDECPRKEQIE